MDADHYLFETIIDVEERIDEYELDLEECEFEPKQRLKIEERVSGYKELLIKLRDIE